MIVKDPRKEPPGLSGKKEGREGWVGRERGRKVSVGLIELKEGWWWVGAASWGAGGRAAGPA